MRLIVTPGAEKQFRKIVPREQKKVEKKLGILKENPLLGKKLGGKLKKFRSLRVWPHRVIYHMDKKQRTIWVDSILHRQRAYR